MALFRYVPHVTSLLGGSVLILSYWLLLPQIAVLSPKNHHGSSRASFMGSAPGVRELNYMEMLARPYANYDVTSNDEEKKKRAKAGRDFLAKTTDELAVRKRPRNLSIVYMGDSQTRFMYISLAYYLRHGKWMDPNENPRLVVPRDFMFGDKTVNHWLLYYNATMKALHPYGNCDCFRHKTLDTRDGYEALCENHYYHDPFHNNTLIYISAWGSKLDMRGHWTDPKQAMTATRRHLIFKKTKPQYDEHGAANVGPLDDKYNYSWRHNTWGDAIRDQVAKIRPNTLVLNAGNWYNKFDDPEYAQNVYDATREIGVDTVWRTSTSAKGGEYTQMQLDHDMCSLFQKCVNVSGWTSQLSTRYYVDRLHFREPIYRKMNEQVLEYVGVRLPRKKKLKWSKIGIEDEGITKSKLDVSDEGITASV